MSRISFIAFLSVGIIWGSNFIYMKWATDLITPMQVVFLRVLFGFIPVLIYALYLKVLKLKHLRFSFHFFMMSLLGTTIYYYFFIKASSLLLSGINGALSGSIPLFTFLAATIFIKEERVTKTRILGILVGLIGVVTIAKPFNADLLNTNLEGVFSITTGSFVLGLSFIYAKKYISPLKIHFAALTTYQLGFPLLLLPFITDLTGITNITTDLHSLLGSIIGLGLLGTGLAYIIYYYLIETLGAVNASSATYIPPIVALFIGYFFIGESITLLDLFATALIFSGVFLINKKSS